MIKRPIALIILDGYGKGLEDPAKNAILAAKTPNLDKLFKNNPTTTIYASGMDVGLPEGQMGNSEVGHTNIGAGRIVYQELTRISKSIADGEFYNNDVLCAAVDNCKRSNSALHIMGLVSDGGVHSHNTHLYALLELAKKRGLNEVYIHCFLDGRDVSPTSGSGFVAELLDKTNEIGVGKIATVMGRYYAMDRDNRWDRVEKAYRAMVNREGVIAKHPVKAIENSYQEDVLDEFVLPTVIEGCKEIKENDSVIFFNFRPDRAREITRTFVDKDFTEFKRDYFSLFYVCMTQYDEQMPNVMVAFKPTSLKNTLGEYISQKGFKQLRIAETEKYAHVTFFFNGGVEEVYPGEDRVLIPSPKVATYDLKPEMSALEVTEEAVRRIESEKYDVIVLNFANCDMVGHTGIFDSAKKAVETVDTCLGKVVDAVLAKGGALMITADHGNADEMLNKSGDVVTAHSTNAVPLVLVGMDAKLKKSGRLADIAPTLLDIMELKKPLEMTGESLILK